MTIKEAIQEAWNNAMEGGYGDWLLTAEPADIAIDMIDHDSDIEALAHGDILYIEGLVRIIQKKAKENV